MDEVKTSKASKTAIAALQKSFADGLKQPIRHLSAPVAGALPEPDPELSVVSSSGDREEMRPPLQDVRAFLLSGGPPKRQKQGHTKTDEDSVEREEQRSFAWPMATGVATVLGSWACQRCTLINGNGDVSPPFCKACGGPRPTAVTVAERMEAPSIVIDLD